MRSHGADRDIELPGAEGIVASAPAAAARAAQPKVAYSVAEFAALFGHHRSWAYRLLYRGVIRKVAVPGQIVIPATEADRLLTTLVEHGGEE